MSLINTQHMSVADQALLKYMEAKHTRKQQDEVVRRSEKTLQEAKDTLLTFTQREIDAWQQVDKYRDDPQGLLYELRNLFTEKDLL